MFGDIGMPHRLFVKFFVSAAEAELQAARELPSLRLDQAESAIAATPEPTA
nr:hypothetical protein [Burkholderia stagnalis]